MSLVGCSSARPSLPIIFAQTRMSNLPPPPIDPLSYYAPYPRLRRRPLSVSIIGWVTTIFGGLGILSGFCIVIQRSQYLSAFQPTNPVTDVLNAPGPMRNYMTVVQILGWFVNALLLIAGIGCLKLKPRARRLMNGIAIYQLFSVVVGIIFYVELINPAFSRWAAQHPNDPSIQMGYRFSVIGQVVGIVLGVAIPITVLYFLTRPHVKAAFESPPPLPPPPPRVDSSHHL